VFFDSPGAVQEYFTDDYELWELSGKPEGRDFYLRALQELQAALHERASDYPG
jgi:hypothetical protein